MSISERSLKKWRKEALLNSIAPDTSYAYSKEQSGRIILLTRELMDIKLLNTQADRKTQEEVRRSESVR